MASVFLGINNRTFTYNKVIGRSEFAGTGLRNPVDLALAANDVIYVLNRSYESRPDGVRVTIMTFDEQYITEFGSYGQGDGQFIWPMSIALDSQENVYVSDEWLSRINVYTKGGEFVRTWGKAGSKNGELNRPAGLAIRGDTIFVVDSRNHRVQKFTLDGKYLAQFGSFGSGPGQLNTPWGIGLDQNGLVYVADWRNDRIQQFTPDGQWQASFGQSSVANQGELVDWWNGGVRPRGAPVGMFNRPTGVAVDQDGDIYVADWMNNRVQVLTPDGRFITEFLGDAGLSKWGVDKIKSNPDMIRQRNGVRDFTPERVLWAPCAVKVDDKGRIAIADTTRNRIQIYQKNKAPVLV